MISTARSTASRAASPSTSARTSANRRFQKPQRSRFSPLVAGIRSPPIYARPVEAVSSAQTPSSESRHSASPARMIHSAATRASVSALACGSGLALSPSTRPSSRPERSSQMPKVRKEGWKSRKARATKALRLSHSSRDSESVRSGAESAASKVGPLSR